MRGLSTARLSDLPNVTQLGMAELGFFFLFFPERASERASRGGAEREGDTETEAGPRLRAVSTQPDVGLEPRSHEIMT